MKKKKNNLPKSIIRQLPKEVVSKVAAGEVVEYPASVVKELIENSIDAKASQIDIEIEDSGFSKIRIIDNGHGMSKEDVLESYKRHTTSKISTEDELAIVDSLGFRGEALYSISAISTTEIKSKINETISGTHLEIVGGIAQKPIPLGMPTGTEVIVRDIFFNLPARKKFFENKQAEYRKIIQTVSNVSLGHPKVGFKLKHNKKVTFYVPKEQSLEERARYVLGDDIFNNLLPFSHEEDYMRIKGFVSKPQNTTTTNDLQFIYVNNRHINDKKMTRNVREAFGTLIDAKAQPIYILKIELPSSMVDVNIHPRKTHVRINEGVQLIEAIKKVIKHTLGIQDLTYTFDAKDEVQEFENFLKSSNVSPKQKNQEKRLTGKKANPHLATVLKETTPLWNIKTNKQNLPDEILQVKKLYLITETKNGIVLFDQHAAHERILYEEFLHQFLKERQKGAQIEIGKTIEIPQNAVDLLKDNQQTLQAIGIEIEHFRKNSFKIIKVPKVYETHDLGILLIELVNDLEGIKELTPDEKSLKTISYLACRTAIKGGDYLTQEERKNLLEKLQKTKTSYTCPHGRPVKIELSFKALAKLFKRS